MYGMMGGNHLLRVLPVPEGAAVAVLFAEPACEERVCTLRMRWARVSARVMCVRGGERDS